MTEAISHGHAASGGIGTNGQQRQSDDAGQRRDQHDREKRIEPDLDQRIPRGVAGRSQQNDGEDERVQPIPSAWRRAGSYGALRLARTGTRSPAMSISKRAGEPGLIDARATGRRIAERDDAADGVAVGRRRDLARRARHRAGSARRRARSAYQARARRNSAAAARVACLSAASNASRPMKSPLSSFTAKASPASYGL